MTTTPTFTDNSRRIFDARYPRKDIDGNPTETPEQTIQRVTDNVAIIASLYEGIANPTESSMLVEDWPARTAQRQFKWLADIGRSPGTKQLGRVLASGHGAFIEQARIYREMISRWDFLPNSPTWTGAGTPLGQLAACFVLPIADDLGRQRDSIFETLRVAALIQQTGGGNGFNFGSLRPSNAIISTSMGKSSGPMGFLRVYDTAFGSVAQGGSRRGANMAIIPIWHPDIRAFIGAKIVEGEISNFNLSVGLTDDFMHAVEHEKSFDLRFGGKVYETVEARELMAEIVNNAWVMGDPGNVFLDRANNFNPVPTRYRLEATNPCGEQYLGPYENCCLGSINLANFVMGHYLNDNASIDWARLRLAIIRAQNFLDDVVDANQYVPSVPELEIAAQGGRRIGLGIMGLADAMLRMGIRYGAQDGIEFTSQVMEYVNYWTMHASIERAQQRGPFEWIKNSIYDPELLRSAWVGAVVTLPVTPGHQDYIEGEEISVEFNLWEPPTSMVPYDHDWGRPALDWGRIEEGIKSHGIRNSCLLTVAPTGTISNVAALEGSGCEPLFALSYIRTMMQENENIQLSYLSPEFETALIKAKISEAQRQIVLDAVADNGGSCQGLTTLVPDSIRRVFVVAADVTVEEHIMTQAACQRFVDNSISKTINMPNEATREDVAEAYNLAYGLGCKGITIYRQGSRFLEVLTTTKATAFEEVVDMFESDTDKATVMEIAERESVSFGGSMLGIGSAVWPTVVPLPIPAYAKDSGLAARVFPVETFYGKLHVTITELDDHPGRPFDVRLQVGKGGNDTNAHVEALGRVISLCLRGGITVRDVCNQLEGIGGQNQWGFGVQKVKSIADGVAKLLSRRYLNVPLYDPLPPVGVPRLVETLSTRPATATVHEAVTGGAGAVQVHQSVDTTMACPTCHQASLVMESGCRKCDARLGGCGTYSGCD